MKSSYKRLGDYIQETDVRDRDLSVSLLLGVSVQKCFIPSIANTVGTDMSTYKIVKRNQFTYIPDTSRRGDKIGIALLEDHDVAIVSQAYSTFKIIDEAKLLPQYLMMWFMRPEFDRYARYMSYGSVREVFSWDDMCDVRLPIPSPKIQREIVAEYQVVQNRMALNKQLIQKLEETAQALYKQWFVDFEFPNAQGQPYKSCGGEMVESELGEIPKGWKIEKLDSLVKIIDGDRGKSYPSASDYSESGHCLFLNAGNVTLNGFNFSDTKFISEAKDTELRNGKLIRGDVVLTSRGTVGNVAYYSKQIPFDHIRINSGMLILRESQCDYGLYIYSMLRSSDYKNLIDSFMSGSAQQQLPIKDVLKMATTIPTSGTIKHFTKVASAIQSEIDCLFIQNHHCSIFTDILLSKLATVEEP